MIKTSAKQLTFLIDLQNSKNDLVKIEKKLSLVDQKIDEIKQKNEAMLTELKEKEKEYEDLKQGYEELKTTYEVNAARIKKSSENIKSVQTNKEYQTLLKEIDENKKKQAHFEEETIRFMESIEKAEKTIESLRTDSKQLDEKTTSDINEIKENSKKEQQELKSIKKKIEGIYKKDVDQDILKNFENILTTQKGNIAIVPVQNLICHGCFMSVPPQTCMELKKGSFIDFCPHCHRMIYHLEPEETKKKSKSKKIK